MMMPNHTANNPIKKELQEMKTKMETLESGQHELQQITRAIRDRQDETDAKLEALSMDVHHLNGKVEGLSAKVEELSAKVEAQGQELHTFRRETSSNFRSVLGHLRLIDSDLDETMERVAELEKRE